MRFDEVKKRFGKRNYQVSEMIPATGIYSVTHNKHRATHEVTLLEGEMFPPCSLCGRDVHFELVMAAPEIGRDSQFRVALYELPHPESEEMSA